MNHFVIHNVDPDGIHKNKGACYNGVTLTEMKMDHLTAS